MLSAVKNASLRTSRKANYVVFRSVATISEIQTRSHNKLKRQNNLSNNYKLIHTTPASNYFLFHEKDRKGGYNKNKPKVSRIKLIKDGFKMLGGELKLWKDEMIEYFKHDPILYYRPGETDLAWHLGTKEGLEKWKVTSDKDHGEGYSTANLEMSSAGYGLFHGNIDLRIPQTGNLKRAGYANLQSIQARRSFQREKYLDWTPYNTLVMRVRGDGRSYMINIGVSGYYDIWWNDIYHYALYTRGGPYWQIAKIPFSKFFLSSKGRIQDNQQRIPLDQITGFGLTVGGQDGSGGPFRLEIDYIGLEFDMRNQEEFAYEMYKTDTGIAAN